MRAQGEHQVDPCTSYTSTYTVISFSPPEHAEMRLFYLSLNEHDILTYMRGQICCLQYFMFFVQIFVDLGTENKAAHVP